MNFRLLASLSVAFTLLLTACNKDKDAPMLTAPADVINVEAGATGQSVDFSVTLAEDVTATYTATGSGVTVTNASGDVPGSTITINYDAGANAGAASITVTVTDSEDNVGTATAVINVNDENTIRVTSNITADETWTSDNTYILGGRISVEAGATLTIEAGTLIKGDAGTGPNATALLIARGAKLIADGTADAPIIFTSVADNITSDDIKGGDFVSPNLTPDISGLWGGLLVLGNATISASNNDDEDISEVQIEGIPTSDPNGLYGGNDDADNSGILRYISIRHGGSNIGEGNEINGLTLGGVGTGTVIENIEVVANQDDGVEWFGGTVSVSNVVVWNAGDDAIDTDQSWAGTLDNFVVVGSSGSLFELDGPEGTYVAAHTITNGTVVAITSDRTIGGSLLDCDSATPVSMSNIHFVAPLFFTNDDDEEVFLTITEDEFANTTLTNVTFDIDGADLPMLMEQGGAVPAGVSAGGTPQANTSVFGWTWASIAGGLDGL